MLLFDPVGLEYPRRTDVLLFAPQANVLFWGLVDCAALRFSPCARRVSTPASLSEQQRRFYAKDRPTQVQPDRLAQLKNPKTIHFLNGFSSAMAPALRGAPGTSEKTEIGAIAPPRARPPVQRRRPEAPARRRNRRTWENDKSARYCGGKLVARR